jgi:26S proteasome regulatory subunit N7
MGSDPQYAKYPNLPLAQDIFTLTNPSSIQSSRQTSLQKLQNAISEHKMAPLYRYLAHPSDGILNVSGEGTARKNSTSNSRKPSGASSMIARRRGSGSYDFPWDDQLYEKLKAENEEELETFQKEEEEAEEKAGETEVQAARGKRAEFWARVGDQVWLPKHQGFRYAIGTNNVRMCRRKRSRPTKLSSKRLAFWVPRLI